MTNVLEIRVPKSLEEIQDTSRLWTTVFRSLADLTDDNPDRWFKVGTWESDAKLKLEGLPSDQFTILAVDNRAVIGAVTGYRMRTSDNLVYAETAAVLKERRGQYVGAMMLRGFLEICTMEKVKAILFDTNKDPKRGGATSVWDSAKFREVEINRIGEIPGYWDGDPNQTGVLYKVQLHGVTWR